MVAPLKYEFFNYFGKIIVFPQCREKFVISIHVFIASRKFHTDPIRILFGMFSRDNILLFSTRTEITGGVHSKETSVWQLWLFK